MDHGNENTRARRSLIPGLLVSGVAVIALVLLADPARAVAALATARPLELVAATVALSAGLVARAAASRELIGRRVGLGASFAALNIGYLANNVLPLRAGEAVRSVVLGRRSGLGVVGGITAVAAERLLDVMFAATILVAALPAAGVDAGWAAPAGAAAAAATGVAVLIALARRRDAVAAWLDPRLAGRPRLARWLPRLTGALEALARRRRVAAAVAWLGLAWLLGVTTLWLVLRAFVPSAPFGWAAFGIGVLAFGIALPSSPGAIGVYEAALVGAMALCGVDPADGLAFAVAAHALSFAVTSACGAAALIRQVPDGAGIVDRARRLLGRGELAAPEEVSR